jgi:hypothetical protein
MVLRSCCLSVYIIYNMPSHALLVVPIRGIKSNHIIIPLYHTRIYSSQNGRTLKRKWPRLWFFFIHALTHSLTYIPVHMTL